MEAYHDNVGVCEIHGFFSWAPFDVDCFLFGHSAVYRETLTLKRPCSLA